MPGLENFLTALLATASGAAQGAGQGYYQGKQRQAAQADELQRMQAQGEQQKGLQKFMDSLIREREGENRQWEIGEADRSADETATREGWQRGRLKDYAITLTDPEERKFYLAQAEGFTPYTPQRPDAGDANQARARRLAELTAAIQMYSPQYGKDNMGNDVMLSPGNPELLAQAQRDFNDFIGVRASTPQPEQGPPLVPGYFGSSQYQTGAGEEYRGGSGAGDGGRKALPGGAAYGINAFLKELVGTAERELAIPTKEEFDDLWYGKPPNQQAQQPGKQPEKKPEAVATKTYKIEGEEAAMTAQEIHDKYYPDLPLGQVVQALEGK
jgi:hypothetical protein